MPPDQPVNPTEEPSSTSSSSVPHAPASRVRIHSLLQIQPQGMRIGRHPHNDIVISNLGVSKQHAELRRSPAGRFSITDLDSHNGTYVNGTRVSQQELKEGDIITIGHATFRLANGELIEYVNDGRSPG